MPLKFVFGPSGSGKKSTGEFHSACTGAVYNADTERSGSYASETRNHEY